MIRYLHRVSAYLNNNIIFSFAKTNFRPKNSMDFLFRLPLALLQHHNHHVFFKKKSKKFVKSTHHMIYFNLNRKKTHLTYLKNMIKTRHLPTACESYYSHQISANSTLFLHVFPILLYKISHLLNNSAVLPAAGR
jgi:hypothetical protein